MAAGVGSGFETRRSYALGKARVFEFCVELRVYDLTAFVRTEIWASKFSPLGILINLNKGRIFNASCGDEQKDSCATSLRIQIAIFLFSCPLQAFYFICP